MYEMYNSYISVPAVTRRVYGYLPYWQSIDLNTFRWDLITDIIPFSVGIGTDGTVSNPHALPGAALVSAAHAHGVKVHLGAPIARGPGEDPETLLEHVRDEIASTLARWRRHRK